MCLPAEPKGQSHALFGISDLGLLSKTIQVAGWPTDVAAASLWLLQHLQHWNMHRVLQCIFKMPQHHRKLSIWQTIKNSIHPKMTSIY